MNNEKSGIKVTFSHNLDFLMNRKGVTRHDLCKALNIKYTTLCDWVKGKTLPRDEALDRLSSFFGIDTGDFFVESEDCDSSQAHNRINRYLSESRRLDMKTLDNMSDVQITELIEAGFTFRHKTLEEYIEESGEKLTVSDELDWGEPVGREIW